MAALHSETPAIYGEDCYQRIRFQYWFMLKKKNVLLIIMIVTAVLLIVAVIIIFNRRIHNIETNQKKRLNTVQHTY